MLNCVNWCFPHYGELILVLNITARASYGMFNIVFPSAAPSTLIRKKFKTDKMFSVHTIVFFFLGRKTLSPPQKG